MKKYLLLLLLLLACIHSQAQTTDSTKTKKISKQFTKEAEPERMTWEVATDVHPWIFNNNNSGAGSIFIRKNITKLKGLNEVYRAYRFKVSLRSVSQFLDTLVTNSRSRSKGLSFDLSGGYEYQSQMGRWQLFYGSDIKVGYSLSNWETPIINGYGNNANTIGVTYNNESGYTIGIMPFLGMKYFIHPRFAISLESSLGASFYTGTINYKQIINNKTAVDNNQSLTNFFVYTYFISALNVSYLF